MKEKQIYQEQQRLRGLELSAVSPQAQMERSVAILEVALQLTILNQKLERIADSIDDINQTGIPSR